MRRLFLFVFTAILATCSMVKEEPPAPGLAAGQAAGVVTEAAWPNE